MAKKEIDIEVINAQKIEKALKGIEPAIAKKILKKVLRESQKEIMMKEVKLNTPTDEGDTKKNVTVRAQKRSRYKKGANVLFKTNKFEDDNFYVTFVEFGAPRSGIEPKGFARKSFEAKKDEAKKDAQKRTHELIDEEVVKKRVK